MNTLCTVAKREKMYQLEEQAEVVPSRIRPDQFYGQPLASAVRTILEMRKQQDLGAATVKEIFEALTMGGYQFNTKNDEVAVASLRNSLSKNTVTFHKLPNGRFGMLNWYPNARPAKAAQNGGAIPDTPEEEMERRPRSWPPRRSKFDSPLLGSVLEKHPFGRSPQTLAAPGKEQPMWQTVQQAQPASIGAQASVPAGYVVDLTPSVHYPED